MLNEGLAAMAVGMGTVFSFLIVLWGVISVLGKVIAYLNKIFPEAAPVQAAAAKNTCADVEVAIAIAMAKLKK
ncbi:MAG: OadG family protein [Candidatus Gastranaerophilales bacterium]|nr:OadG family protein [Candidatus Gastranaerophilales bacterium]